MTVREERLGEAAMFLLPSLKLKKRSADGARELEEESILPQTADGVSVVRAQR